MASFTSELSFENQKCTINHIFMKLEAGHIDKVEKSFTLTRPQESQYQGEGENICNTKYRYAEYDSKDFLR